jgi:DNA-binding NtrC family response regulator
MSKPIIVCIDDDPAILDVVVRCIGRLEVEVRRTENPAEALDWISRERVAVLVSDYDMPQMTGAQLAGQVKVLRPETVRILLTGQRSLETAIDGINQGEIFRFLSKPFEPETLRTAIKAAVVRHDELVLLTGDRDRRLRRDALSDALEEEHPGITLVMLIDGVYQIDESILALAPALGLTRAQ